MAAKASNVTLTVTEDIPKWKIALAVGAPVALGLAGMWFYKRQKGGAPKESDDKTEQKQDDKNAPALKPLDKAQAAKNTGNKYFKGGKYTAAIKCYTQAIDVCPTQHATELATFYQNRAAAYEQLKNYEQVVSDCTQALVYNNKYAKALMRRARASEVTKNLTQSLEDVTAVCILESFQNHTSLMMADRVLKEMGRTKAAKAYQNRKPIEPSKQFVRTYFSAFANDPIVASTKNTESGGPEGSEGSEPEKDRDETPEKEKSEDLETTITEDIKPSPYQQALNNLQNKNYGNIPDLCSSEINLSNTNHLPESLLLRATFYLLRGEGQKALEDFDRLLSLDDVDKRIRSNALIKRGSMRMQNGNQTEALDDFATAVREDPENSDIYHHRGQLNLLIDRVGDAVKDFEKSVTLSPNFPITQVQKCYTEYRQATNQSSPMQLQTAMKSFAEALKQFPDCSEGYALYGQSLCDQGMFDQADDYFKKALELEPDNGNIYVHRGLLRLQWKQDVNEAAKLIGRALETDEKCEFAYETLGTIEVQRGHLDRSIELFNKAISLAKTEIEMSHLYSLLDAAIAQSNVAKNFGIQVPL